MKNKVVINNSAYMMSDKTLQTVLSIAKDSFKAAKKHAIYAVTKDGVTTMLKNVYDQYPDMLKAHTGWERQGYEVHFVAGRDAGK